MYELHATIQEYIAAWSMLEGCMSMLLLMLSRLAASCYDNQEALR